jgi:hypothetical protein
MIDNRPGQVFEDRSQVPDPLECRGIEDENCGVSFEDFFWNCGGELFSIRFDFRPGKRTGRNTEGFLPEPF